MRNCGNELMVTIRCLAYNHEAYIRQCLDGFVMQRTSFRFEAIVHDDASTDGTAGIIREYAERYPDIIKPIFETENQYSKHDGSIRRIMNQHTRGKYVAMCEGDDYWIDPLKLQKQVDFLEQNEDCSMCSSGYLFRKNGKIIGHDILKRKNGGFKYTVSDLNIYWYCKTLTVLYRADKLSKYLLFVNDFKYSRDYYLFYYLLKEGKGYYFSEIFGVYNMHSGGVCSLIPMRNKAQDRYNCSKELYTYTKDPVLKIRLFSSILALLRYGGYSNKKEKYKLFVQLFMNFWLFVPLIYNSFMNRILKKRAISK